MLFNQSFLKVLKRWTSPLNEHWVLVFCYIAAREELFAKYGKRVMIVKLNSVKKACIKKVGHKNLFLNLSIPVMFM